MQLKLKCVYKKKVIQVHTTSIGYYVIINYFAHILHILF